MGKVMSIVSRKVNRFNVENRAHRILEREKPVAAPKYEGNLRDMERTMELDPSFLTKLNKKDSALDDRLKSVYVTSEDSFIDHKLQRSQASKEKQLPLDRHTAEDFEMGYLEPQKITIGRCTLRQAMHFIANHQAEPNVWTADKIAEDYKMKPELVENILKHFRSYNIYIPDDKSKDSILTQARQNFLADKRKDDI